MKCASEVVVGKLTRAASAVRENATVLRRSTSHGVMCLSQRRIKRYVVFENRCPVGGESFMRERRWDECMLTSTRARNLTKNATMTRPSVNSTSYIEAVLALTGSSKRGAKPSRPDVKGLRARKNSSFLELHRDQRQSPLAPGRNTPPGLLLGHWYGPVPFDP